MNDPITDIGAGPGDGSRRPAFRPKGILATLLRVPMFLKILLANVLIAAVAGGVAVLLTPVLAGAPPEVALTLFVAGVLSLGTALNAVVVRLALSPLVSLRGAAERVRRGDLAARAALSRLADDETRALVLVFNRMLDTLQEGRRRQRVLTRQVLEAEERERERISQELFAGPAQTLAGAMVRLRLAGRTCTSPAARDRNGCAARDEEVRDQIALALEEIRVLARRLRPPELGELGVLPALEARARALTEQRSIQVRISGATPLHMEPATATVLFRVLDEAMTNAVIHSGGTAVDILLEAREDRVAAEVHDDGRGLGVPGRPGRLPPGLGIAGMQERASYLGGAVTVASRANGGTRVRVELPLRTPHGPDPAPALASSGAVIEDSAPTDRKEWSVGMVSCSDL